MDYIVTDVWMRPNMVEASGLSITDLASRHRGFVKKTGRLASLIIADGWILGSAPLHGMPPLREDYPGAMRQYLDSIGMHNAQLWPADELETEEFIITLGTRDVTGRVRSLDALLDVLDDIVGGMDHLFSQSSAWMKVNLSECAFSCAWKQTRRSEHQYEFIPGARLRIVLGNLDLAESGLKLAQRLVCQLMQALGQTRAIIEYGDRAQMIRQEAKVKPAAPAAPKPAAPLKWPAARRRKTPPTFKEPALYGRVDALPPEELLRQAIELATHSARDRLDVEDPLGSNQIIGAAYVGDNNESMFLSPDFRSGTNRQADVDFWHHVMSEFKGNPPAGFLRWVVFFTAQPPEFVQEVAKVGAHILPPLDSVLAEGLQHWTKSDAGIVFICEGEVLVYSAQDVAHLPTRQELIWRN